jgi:outer membrane protein assembly factor BamB
VGYLKRLALATVGVLATLNLTGAARAQDWANWRGPGYNGATVAKGLPVKFSPTEGVKWVADLPGPSAATPVVVGDNVYVSSVDAKNETLVALCLDRKTGKAKWQHNAGSGYRPAGGEGNAIQIDGRSNYASPSPTADGKRAFFFYGNGDLAAFTPGGEKLWTRNLQKDYGDFAFQWTFSSSPLLHGGKLYLQILQRDRPVGPKGKPNAESFLLALDPATGKELWRVVRPSPAIMESREAFTTPVPVTHEGKTQIVIAGGDVVTGHDPATGKELWRWGTWNEENRVPHWRLVPSPVAGGGSLLVCAPKRAPVYAVKLGGSGDLGAGGLAWKSEERSPVTSDVPTPLYYEGKFYVLSDVRRSLSCLDPKTGGVAWTVEVPGRAMCWASPTGADGKIYLMNLDGTVFVMDAASGKLLGENPMDAEGSEARSSVVVAHGNLFVRTSNKLYCVGK